MGVLCSFAIFPVVNEAELVAIAEQTLHLSKTSEE